MSNMNKTAGILLIVVGIVLIALGPISTILAVNALFGTSIEVTFINWLAMLWLQLLFVSRSVK